MLAGLFFKRFTGFLQMLSTNHPSGFLKKKHECQQYFCLKRATPPRFSKFLGFFTADVCCNVQNMFFFSKMVGKKLGKIDR